jgi:peptide/nickel transport system substrate-binding protein
MIKVFVVLISVLIIFILILGGCTSSTTTPAKPAPSPAPSLTQPSSPAMQTPATPTAQSGGTLHIGTIEGFQNIGDPRVSRVPFDGCIRHLFYEEPVRFDKDGNIIPWLASSWQYSNDYKSLTLTLQKGVKYHDGTSFNAQSVKDCLDAYKAAKMPQLSTVTSIDVVDEYNVRLNTDKFDATLLGLLAQTPAGQMVSPTAMNKYSADEMMRTPVGTGPFKLASYDPGNKIVATKNPDYWIKGRPYLDGMDCTYIKDPTVAKMAFERGEVDVIPRLDPPQGTELMNSGKYKNLFVSPSGFEFMLAGDNMNADSPWSKLKVRQAAMYAVDVDAMIKKIGQGVAVVCRRLFQANSPFYNPAPVPYSYDPSKARTLLTEAGYSSGFDTTIYLRTPTYQDYATVVQSYFNDVGIRANVKIMTTAEAADLTTKGWKNGLLEILGPNTAEREASVTILNYYAPGNTYNASVGVAQDVVALCTQALSEPDIKKRIALSLQADSMIVDRDALLMNYATIPFIVPKQSWVHDDNFRFFVGHYWTPEKAWIEKH